MKPNSPQYMHSSGDYNDDGKPDMIVAGNFFGAKIQFGEYDANKGLLLTGDGKGKFRLNHRRRVVFI